MIIGDEIHYEYDFGDGWQHLIELQKVTSPVPGQMYPQLLKGKGACPPEDCGGVWGYYHLVEAINDPKHEDHKDMKRWLGVKQWDVHAFDLEKARKRVDRYFKQADQMYLGG